MLDTAAPTAPAAQQLLLPPAGYPITADGWVTYQRVRVPGVGLVLVQKRDGCTRSVRA